jgi:hypothetical protein
MQDIKQRLEKLRADAEECQLISQLATNPVKRNAFAQLADEYRKMAHDLEALIASGNVPGDLGI